MDISPVNLLYGTAAAAIVTVGLIRATKPLRGRYQRDIFSLDEKAQTRCPTCSGLVKEFMEGPRDSHTGYVGQFVCCPTCLTEFIIKRINRHQVIFLAPCPRLTFSKERFESIYKTQYLEWALAKYGTTLADLEKRFHQTQGDV